MEQVGANIPPIKVYPDKFDGQVVIVTGGASGIGEVTARLFAAQGAHVVILDLNRPRAEEIAAELSSKGAKVTAQVANLTVEADVSTAIQVIISTLRKIDVLVHLAGIYPFKPLLECTAADYHHIMSVNMESCFYMTKAVLPHMQKAGYGRIINTASSVILQPEFGLSLYNTAKSAIAGFTRSTALEAGPGITANVLAPGLIRTEMTWNNPGGVPLPPDAPRPIFEAAVAKQVVKRQGLPRDVAHTICWLASPEAEFITGQVYEVGGGYTYH